tara:strand:+ start:774 stop:1448 length:675 start_codon:yes stop_codon:yes gene_type:complete
MLSKLYEKIHILQNLYLKNKCFLKRKSYSMDGEDIEISKYFKNKENGFYVDVGSYHPIERNNTMLLYKKGWEGINIDISNFSIKLFKHLRPKDANLNIAISKTEGCIEMYFQKKLSQLSTIKKIQAQKSFQGEVKTRKIVSKTLTSVLNNSKFKERKIDLLDIDVEGADLDVLESLDFKKYCPEIICIEVIEKNNEDSHIFNFLKKKSYERIWSGVFSHIFKKT